MLGHAHHRSLSQHNLHKASVILAPMSLCNPFLPSSAKRPLLLPFRAAAFVAPAFFSLPPPPVFSSLFFFLLFSSSSLHPLLIVSLLGSCSFFPFISLLSIIFKHPIFASILRSVLDVASTLSTIYLINSLLSFLLHLVVSYSLPCLSVQGISFYSSTVL